MLAGSTPQGLLGEAAKTAAKTGAATSPFSLKNLFPELSSFVKENKELLGVAGEVAKYMKPNEEMEQYKRMWETQQANANAIPEYRSVVNRNANVYSPGLIPQSFPGIQYRARTA
jgi:hypothetical protein